MFGGVVRSFFSIYLFLKHLVLSGTPKWVANNTTIKLLLLPVLLALTSFFMLVIYLTLAPFYVYKAALVVILKIRHRSNFCEMLGPIDTLFATIPFSPAVTITTLIIVEFDGSKEQFLELVKEAFVKKLVKTERLTSVVRKFGGHYYFLKNQVGSDDVIGTIDTYDHAFCDKETLWRAVNDNVTRPYPKNGMFEILAGQVPLKLQGLEATKQYYAVIAKSSHVAFDGKSLMTILLQELVDDKDSILPLVSVREKKTPWSIRVKMGVEQVYKLLMHYSLPILDHFGEEAQKCILKQTYAGNPNDVFLIEDTPERVHKVKFIKRSVPGCSFFDVITTAISATVHEYYKKRTADVPETINIFLVMAAKSHDVRYEKTKPKNSFRFTVMKVDIRAGDEEKDLLKKLMKTKKEREKFLLSYDTEFGHSLLSVVNLVAPNLCPKLVDNMYGSSTMMFSNVPGVTKARIAGHELKDLVFLLPMSLMSGLSISFLTYDGRFQLGLSVDKCVVPQIKDSEGILQDIFRHIDLMYEEVILKHKNYMDISVISCK